MLNNQWLWDTLKRQAGVALTLVALAIVCPVGSATAEEAEGILERQTLTGDWWGTRSALEEQGIIFEGR